jgi:glutathione S-transferase
LGAALRVEAGFDGGHEVVAQGEEILRANGVKSAALAHHRQGLVFHVKDIQTAAQGAAPLRFLRQPLRATQIDKIDTSLQALDAKPELLANRLDIGSITIACALWYLDLRFPELGWRERYPQVAAWYAAYSQRPATLASWALPS